MGQNFMLLEDAVEMVLKRAREYAESRMLSPEDSQKLSLAANVIEDHFVNSVFDGTEAD